MHMARVSNVDVDSCFLLRALTLMHMYVGPDRLGHEQSKYGKRNLDKSPHAPELYQKRLTTRRKCPGEELIAAVTTAGAPLRIISLQAEYA
jgi:hypothetical protein